MTCRSCCWGAPLLLAAAGCFLEGAGTLLVSPETFQNGAKLPTAVKRAPATEEAAKRALAVGQKILTANSQLGARPLIFTIGGPEPEIFHTESGQIFLTDGLVRQCATDGQLAAVLCQEMARITAEQNEQVSLAKASDHGGPDDNRAGNDYRSGFGNADGLRLNDLAREDQEQRRQAATAPEPAALARQYLRKAGYTDADFAAAAPLLRTAKTNEKFKQFITSTTAIP